MAEYPAGSLPLRNLGGGAHDRHAAGRVQHQLQFQPLGLGEHVRVERRAASSDPDTATAETVQEMCRQVRDSVDDPIVQRTARSAAASFKGGPLYKDPFGPGGLARSCWWWAKHAITFDHHEPMIRQLLNEPGQLQLLTSPRVLMRTANKRGDCAIFTEAICALLSALGVQWEIITLACDPREPAVYSHVYPRAVMPDGSRLALDASHGRFPGWQVPSAHMFRKQVWDEWGRPVGDLDARFAGLNGYGYMGLGGDNETTLSFPWGAPTTTPAPSPGGGFDWGGLFGSLANQWTQIGSRVIAPTTEIRGPGGVSVITPGSSPLAASAVGGAVGAGASLPGGVLLWGGAALAIVLVVAMSKAR